MAFADNANENYGGRMRALFIPLVSGNWRLFMSSDDPGELWFNPNGGSPAGRQRVAFETACCNLYQPAGASQTSPAFPLVAGQGYYIELIYKENAGGDYGMVAARLDGAGTAVGGNDQGAETGDEQEKRDSRDRRTHSRVSSHRLASAMPGGAASRYLSRSWRARRASGLFAA
jgi:hypothetical protein